MKIENFLALTEEARENLQELDFSDGCLPDDLPPQTWEAFCQALAQCKNLKKFNLSGKPTLLRAKKGETLFRALAQCKNLQELCLYNNNIGELDNECFKVFCEALAQFENLQKLNLMANYLSSLDTACWVS